MRWILKLLRSSHNTRWEESKHKSQITLHYSKGRCRAHTDGWSDQWIRRDLQRSVLCAKNYVTKLHRWEYSIAILRDVKSELVAVWLFKIHVFLFYRPVTRSATPSISPPAKCSFDAPGEGILWLNPAPGAQWGPCCRETFDWLHGCSKYLLWWGLLLLSARGLWQGGCVWALIVVATCD